MVLDRELLTFRTNLPDLLEKAVGRFVLIHGDDILGTWETEEQALEEGYERFLHEPFLVKRIVANEQPIFMP